MNNNPAAAFDALKGFCRGAACKQCTKHGRKIGYSGAIGFDFVNDTY